MNKKKAIQIIHDREVLGLSYRSLGEKYKLHFTTVRELIMKRQEDKTLKEKQAAVEQDPDSNREAGMPDDLKLLKEELRKARLKIELQDLMIDIASKELGVDIRKKSGTRRSK